MFRDSTLILRGSASQAPRSSYGLPSLLGLGTPFVCICVDFVDILRIWGNFVGCRRWDARNRLAKMVATRRPLIRHVSGCGGQLKMVPSSGA
jgi:hypothetical protein